jgi:YVTN family beta-propeller protein
MFVANSYWTNGGSLEGTVSVISDSNNTVLANVKVGANPFYLAYDSGRGEMFVTNNGDGTVSVVSDSTNTVVANVTVEGGPWGVAYDSGKGEVFVVNQMWGSVSVISDNTNAVVATVPLGEVQPNGIAYGEPHCAAYDFAKGEIFVGISDNGTVSVISDSTSTSASPTPTVPEFSSAVFILMIVAVVIVTLCALALAVKNRKQ